MRVQKFWALRMKFVIHYIAALTGVQQSLRHLLHSCSLWCKMSVNPVLRFTKLTPNASAPSRGSQYAAGYDLRSAYEYSIPSKGKLLVKTDIAIAIPNGYYGRIAARSGLALKEFIDIGGGVIDEDYRGNVGIIVFNFGDKDFKVAKGDRVAQLICEKICYPVIEEVESLEETDRGTSGFGSSGKQ